jgi:hypothetical protein
VKLNINPVEVHPQLSNNRHPVDGFTFPLPPHPPNVIPSGYLTGMHWKFENKFEKENGGAFPKIEHPPHNKDTQSILENKTPSIQGCRKHSRKQNALHTMVQRAFHHIKIDPLLTRG